MNKKGRLKVYSSTSLIYILNPNDDIVPIDALFLPVREEGPVKTDASGNWPAMDRLLAQFLPVLITSEAVERCVHTDEHEVYLS